ncbi:RrF2 family transcriptional regulator [Bilifractor sp. HCP3S3_D3]|uniref:RrF2 family transcriptional regulator n=1 Tax=Bilifractor sp. HCP3S3_D3 TaxID=3438907 RepID=UPI003F8BC1B0
MLITRETDYALRILRALADGERHNVKELCESEAVPLQFAYKILRKLTEAGIVKSVRGVNGGTELTADLSRLTLLDVIRITESDSYISDCMSPGYHCTWSAKNCRKCTIHSRLCGIQQKLDHELAKLSIRDLLKTGPDTTKSAPPRHLN